jgi:Sulfotransferase family
MNATHRPSTAPAPPLLVWALSGTATSPLIDGLAKASPKSFPACTVMAESHEWRQIAASASQGDAAALRERLVAALSAENGALICGIDDEPAFMHLALVDAAASLGIQHLLLCDRDPFDRLAAAWQRESNPAVAAMRRLVRRAEAAHTRLAQVFAALRLSQQPCRMVSIESLSQSRADGGSPLQAWADLLAYLNLDGTEEQLVRRAHAEFVQALSRQAAPEASPSLDLPALKRELAWIRGPWIDRSFLRRELTTLAKPAGLVRRFQLDSPPILTESGSVWPIEGSVVVADRGDVDDGVTIRSDQRAAASRPENADSSSDAAHLRCERPSSPRLRAKKPNPLVDEIRIGFRGLGRRVVPGDRWHFSYEPGDTPTEPAATVRFKPYPRPALPGIFVSPWSIGYRPIPKVACTSLKEAFFALATGGKATADHLVGAKYIHDYFEARQCDVSGANFKFIVVRDPVARFLSGFTNRVMHHRELSEGYLRALRIADQLPLDSFIFNPTLAQFVEHFELYALVPTIRHHFSPMADQVADLSAFDKVYPLESMDTLCADISRLTGRTFVVPREQQSIAKLRTGDVSKSVRRAILRLCKRDYALLKGYYAAPKDD